jgi:hypothetical protein
LAWVCASFHYTERIRIKRIISVGFVLLRALAGSWITNHRAVAQSGRIIYVNQTAPPSGGDGQSRATAHRSLRTALAAAQAGDEIWVAAGVYKSSPRRFDAFELKNEVVDLSFVVTRLPPVATISALIGCAVPSERRVRATLAVRLKGNVAELLAPSSVPKPG